MKNTLLFTLGFLAFIGMLATMGGLECDTISFGQAYILLPVFFITWVLCLWAGDCFIKY